MKQNINTYNEQNKHSLPFCITNDHSDNNIANYTSEQFLKVSINVIDDASKYGVLPVPSNSSSENTNIIMNNRRLYNVMNII